MEVADIFIKEKVVIFSTKGEKERWRITSKIKRFANG